VDPIDRVPPLRDRALALSGAQTWPDICRARTGQLERIAPDHSAQRRGGGLRAQQDRRGLMKAFLAVHGTQGAASASVRETVDA
jgi:ribonucleoside-diphosphate reductase alpha chain